MIDQTQILPSQVLNWFVNNQTPDRPTAIDIETTGLDPLAPGSAIVGVSLANADRCVYLDTRAWTPLLWRAFRHFLDLVPWIAHNATFDLAWLTHHLGRMPHKFFGCTKAFFRLLSNEGYPGQSFSLGVAEVDVLGWPVSHKTALEDLLVKHGIVKSGRPDKGRMCELAALEPQAFGEYGAQDADACWQLWDELWRQSERWPVVRQFAVEEWPCQIRLIVESRLAGIKVDRDKLSAFHAQLKINIRKSEGKLRTNSKLRKHIGAWEKEAALAHYRLDYKKTYADAVDCPEAMTDLASTEWLPSPTKRDPEKGKWVIPLHTPIIRNANAEPPKFNFNSDTQLRWLLYEKLYRAELVPTLADDPSWAKPKFKIWLEEPVAEADPEGLPPSPGYYVLVDATDGGNPPVGKAVLPMLGEVGQLLGEFNSLGKLEGYVAGYLADSAQDGRAHPEFNAPGTATGRLSGGGGEASNYQQIPKVQAVMECFVADAGYTLIDTDFSSLEPKVAAYFSQDPTHLELFASGLNHDVYLYVSMALFPDLRADIAAVYLPNAPTAESVAAAKKQFKTERTLAKLIHLACGYGASAKKIYQSILLAGIKITVEEVVELRARYWELFAGIKSWEAALKQERTDRDGWIYGAQGMPMAVPDFRVKDLCNLFCQSGGHNSLLTLLYHIDKLRRERGVKMRPWLPNSHDQTTWQVANEDVERAKSVFADAFLALQAEQASTVPLTGSTDVGQNFWTFKSS